MHLDVKPGDRLYHLVGGAAGHGAAYQRDPEQVLEDVIDENISPHNARLQYGLIDPISMTVDLPQTIALRSGAGDTPTLISSAEREK